MKNELLQAIRDIQTVLKVEGLDLEIGSRKLLKETITALQAAMAQAVAQPTATEILGAVARGWCHPINAKKVMDADLAVAIGAEVNALIVGA